MEREFPTQYSRPLVKVLKAISMGTPNVVGSSADHRILYSADYDLVESMKVGRLSERQFQKKIKQIQKIGKITDIKCGEITSWNLLSKPSIKNGKVKNYDHKKELAHLSQLWQQQIITHDEFMNGTEKLVERLEPVQFLLLRKELRFGLLRWSVKEVEQGYKTLRTNEIITLEDAFKTKGITKVDVVAWITNKYVEVSNIIVWLKRNNQPYTYVPHLYVSLTEDILLYAAEENYVKVAKRMYSLAKQYKDVEVQNKISTMLNSPIGQLYMLVADLEVLQDFPNAIKQARKRKQLDLLKDYFAKLYFPELNKATPNLELLPKLEQVLQDECKAEMKKQNLLPIPRDYRI